MLSSSDECKSYRPDSRLAEWLADYPATLFNDALYQSIELVDRYSVALAGELLERLGVVAALQDWQPAAAICQRLGFSPSFQPLLDWLLAYLMTAGWLADRNVEGRRQYRAIGPWPAAGATALRARLLAVDPANAATLDLLDAAAAAYPAVARAELSGEQALFGPDNSPLWLAYFHNSNPLYAVNNHVSALAAVQRLAERPRWCILELGAGAGSGSEALLQALAERQWLARIKQYRVTEPTPFLRRRSERLLKSRYPGVPLSFGALDINQPWAGQGVAEGEFDLVYGVNTLHVAQDLRFSLHEAHRVLTADGWLVAGECIRPFPGQPVYIELVFQLLDSFRMVKTDPVERPTAGFLTPEQWRQALIGAGFGEVQITPDHERIRAIYPRLFIGAVCGRSWSKQSGETDPLRCPLPGR